jgi:hypothetical protein
MSIRRSLVLALLTILVAAMTATSIATAPVAAASHPHYFSVSDPDAFPGSVHQTDAQIRVMRNGFLRTAKAVGATHVRIWVWWHLIEGCDPTVAEHSMDQVLTSIRQVRAAGLEPMIAFVGVAADWGHRENCPPGWLSPGFNPSPIAYGNFVTKVADKVLPAPYGVRIFETYNEPDHPTFLCVMPTTLPHLTTHAKVTGTFTYAYSGISNNGAVDSKVPVGHFMLGATDPKGNPIPTDKTCNEYSRTLGVKRLRALHNESVKRIEKAAGAVPGITDPRGQITILFGDVTGGGKTWLGWALRDSKKLHGIDGIAVHPYLREPSKSRYFPTQTRWNSINPTTKLIAKSCHPTMEKPKRDPNGNWVNPKNKRRYRIVEVHDPRYLGVECLGRLRSFLANKAPQFKDRIYVTEAGLTPGISGTGMTNPTSKTSNIFIAMNHMYGAPGVQMLNWYDIARRDDTESWQTWLSDLDNHAGDPELSPRGLALRAWATGKFPVSAAWLPAAPGLAPCVTDADLGATWSPAVTWSDAHVECDGPAPSQIP